MEKTAVRIQGRESVAMTTAEFGRLFATWRARFEAIACRYVRSAAVAEDLVSDSFMSFWENRGRIPADANLQAYILIIVRNKCLDWLRAQSLHAKIEQEVYELRRRVLAADIRSLQAFNPEEIFSAEVAAIVWQSLDRLPELTRSVRRPPLRGAELQGDRRKVRHHRASRRIRTGKGREAAARGVEGLFARAAYVAVG